MSASDAGMGMPELIKRFLETAHDLSNSNEFGATNMHLVCNEIGLKDSDCCEKIMNGYFRMGHIAAVKGGPQVNASSWFTITPRGSELVRQWRGR